jgi:cytochrome c biogenesis factor
MFNINFSKTLAACLIALFTFATVANAATFTTNESITPNNSITLPAGTTVVLELVQRITPKSVAVGNAIRLKVRDNVKINGKVLISAGTTVIGKVIAVKCCKGEASITIQVEDAKAVDGTMVKLNGDPHIMESNPCQDEPCDARNMQIEIGTMLTAEVRDDVKIGG